MKLVRENINFERGQDPKKALRIGSHANPYIIYNIEKDMEDGGFTFDIKVGEMKDLVRKYIPEISDNEMNRFFAFTLQEIYDSIPDRYFENEDLDWLQKFIEHQIDRESRSWMSINSDENMRKLMR